MTDIVFDTETTGLPLWREPSEHPGQPHVVEIAIIELDDNLVVANETRMLVRPDGWTIPAEATAIHGITTERALDEGVPAAEMLETFVAAAGRAERVAAHNALFDARMMRIIAHKLGVPDVLDQRKADLFCTMRSSTDLVRIPSPCGGWKWPSLTETTHHFFDEDLEGAHGVLVDARACARIYRHLRQLERMAGRIAP